MPTPDEPSFHMAGAPRASLERRLFAPCREDERREVEARARAYADDAALWSLAEGACPTDVQEFGERHRIPRFAEATWIQGFMTGWRAFARAQVEADPDSLYQGE